MTTDAATSARMRRIRQRGTSAELTVRRALTRLGHRYRVNVGRLPGRPDAANERRRWAIFVHGCFWHAHVGCPRATIPKRNADFWRAKFADNAARDLRKVAALEETGFLVLIVWECEVESPAALAARLAELPAPHVSSSSGRGVGGSGGASAQTNGGALRAS